MISNITLLAGVLQTLFVTDAKDLARTTKMVKRERKLTGPVFAQTLVFGWLAKPDATLEELADFAFACGTDVSFQAIDQRITANAIDFTEQLLCRALEYCCCVNSDVLPLLDRFEGVYTVDTSDIKLPDSMALEFPGLGGSGPQDGLAGCAVQVCLELTGQGIVDLQLGSARTHELAYELAHTGLPVGALRLADLGFFSLDMLDSYDQEGVYYISRWKPHMTLQDEQGRKFELAEYLRQQGGVQLDRWVYAGNQRVRARLVAVRLSEEAAARRRQKLLARKKGKGKKASLAMLSMCEWDVTITNVPAGKLSVDEVISLRRLRWQIELLFKTFKSVGGLEHLAGHRRERVLVELFAKLLGQVVQSWQLLVGCGSPVRWSWYRAAKRQRRWWQAVVLLLGHGPALACWLDSVARRLRRSARKQTRQKHPASFQFTLDPADPAYANGARFPLT
jgi:hypothetical protein